MQEEAKFEFVLVVTDDIRAYFFESQSIRSCCTVLVTQHICNLLNNVCTLTGGTENDSLGRLTRFDRRYDLLNDGFEVMTIRNEDACKGVLVVSEDAGVGVNTLLDLWQT